MASVRAAGSYMRLEPQTVVAKKASPKTTFWGELDSALKMIQVPSLQSFIQRATGQSPGQGITIAMFDAGFNIHHPALRHLVDSARVLADSDFVLHAAVSDTTDDPGDVEHGTGTLSLIAGYAPRIFVGAAYGARFILARTEYGPTETHAEEDNWIAALEWAEALGADIINSSLGYRYDFDGSPNYPDSMMNGDSIPISRAAAMAVDRGVVIVNSAGNDAGRGGATTLNAPADARSIITVGAVNYAREVTSFSSYGPTYDGRIKPDVVAPGSNIPYASAKGGYDYNSGTSFSSPLTAGAIALIKQVHPEWSPEEIVSVLHRTSTRHANPNNYYGYGMVQAFAAALNAPGALDSNTVWGIVETPEGQPISGAEVHFSGPTTGTTGTDTDGMFVIGRALPGDYDLTIQHDGYTALRTTVRAPVDSMLIFALAPIAISSGPISVYPIPCRGKLTFEFKADDARLPYARYFIADLYTIDGCKIRTLRFEVADDENVRREMDLSGLKRGLYYCRIRFADTTRLLKIPLLP